MVKELLTFGKLEAEKKTNFTTIKTLFFRGCRY